jgi:uncharacterized protein YwgA
LVEPNDIALLIAVVGLHNSGVKGRTRIQKEMCILKHEKRVPLSFEFTSHNYGPYSAELSDTIDTLVASELLQQSTVLLGPDIHRYDYTLTKQGKKLFQSIMKSFKRNPKLVTDLKVSVKKLEDMSIPDTISLAKQCSGIKSQISDELK